jgi:hypothetical protein
MLYVTLLAIDTSVILSTLTISMRPGLQIGDLKLEVWGVKLGRVDGCSRTDWQAGKLISSIRFCKVPVITY